MKCEQIYEVAVQILPAWSATDTNKERKMKGGLGLKNNEGTRHACRLTAGTTFPQ